jgi:hypothetical protein
MIEIRTYAPEQRAKALVEALPYIKQFRDSVIVVKYGGSAMADPGLATTFAEDIVLLRSVGLKPVVVHGGGPQIGIHLEKLGKETRFQDGLRVTDAETLDVVRMILVGTSSGPSTSTVPSPLGFPARTAGSSRPPHRTSPLAWSERSCLFSRESSNASSQRT